MIVPSEFSPSWWLRNPHVQTVLSAKAVLPPAPAVTHQRIERADGDFSDLTFSAAFEQQTARPIVAMLHGLAGCHASAYVRGAFTSLTEHGFRVVLMHWRGCSGEPNRLARSYHSGSSDEIAWFIDWLATQYPAATLHALGYSLGANALVKYLGEAAAHTPLASAVAISPPLVLSLCADRMNQGLSRAYQRYLVKLMRGQYHAKRARYPTLELPPLPRSANSFWSFDDAVTAPLHGFDGVHDYYERASCRQFLPSVALPLHLLCVRDDPFFAEAVLPESRELSATTTLEISQRGGHMGFLCRASVTGRWLDQRVAEVLAAQSSRVATPARESSTHSTCPAP